MKRRHTVLLILCVALTLTSCVGSAVSMRKTDRILDRIDALLEARHSVSADALVPDTDLPETDVPVDEVPALLERSDADGEVSTPLFWKATSPNGGTLYLLGSIHVGLDDTNIYPDEIIDAFNSSDALAVESDVLAIEKSMETQIALLRPMIYTDGTRISAHIPGELYNTARDLMKSLGIYNVMMDYYKPVMWQQMIDQTLTDATEYKSENGVDRYFLAVAKRVGKVIDEVEDPAVTYNSLASFSEKTQEFVLSSTVDEEYLDTFAEDLGALWNAWKHGDEPSLTSLLYADFGKELTETERDALTEYNEVMLTSRNRIMCKAAQSYLDGGDTVFFVVGLAHMLGDGGIVDTLTAHGYAVERVDIAK